MNKYTYVCAQNDFTKRVCHQKRLKAIVAEKEKGCENALESPTQSVYLEIVLIEK